MSLPPTIPPPPHPYFAVFFFPVIGFLQLEVMTRSSKKKVIQQVKWPYASFYLPLMLNETS